MSSTPVDVNGKSSDVSSTQNLTHATLASATSLMGLQLLSRLVTFGLNQALIRIASPQVFGTASIQLELLLNTILFLSREGIRNAFLRAKSDHVHGKSERSEEKRRVESIESGQELENKIKAANLALLPLYFGFTISFATALLYRHYASPTTKSQPYFDFAIVLYVVAAVVELLSEPMHLRAVQQFHTSVRVRAEGMAVVARTGATFAILVLDSVVSNGSGQLGLMAFALGQFIYGVVLFISYSSAYGMSTSLGLRRVADRGSEGVQHQGIRQSFTNWLQNYFDKALLQLSFALTAQSLVKHFLTEGDKLIIAKISPLKDQGGYAVANNYGSLVARIFFQPIEESSRLFFAKVLYASSAEEQTPTVSSLHTASQTLTSILLVQSHMFLFLLSLAPPYLPLLMKLLLSRSYLYTSAPRLLAAWIWYIPVLGINGILEAFVSSVASPSDLQRQSRWMSIFSIIFVFAVVLFYRVFSLGDVALVYANIVNLCARILFCGHFITVYFRRHTAASGKDLFRWNSAIPPWGIIVAFTLLFAITRVSSVYYDMGDVMRIALSHDQMSKVLLHVGVGVLSGLIGLGVCWLVERRDIVQVFRFVAQQRRSKNE